MTDKEKLLKGLELIKEALHDETIVEGFEETSINLEDLAGLHGKNDFCISFMIADGYEREPICAYFDKDGTHVSTI